MSTGFPNVVEVITPAIVGKISTWDEVNEEDAVSAKEADEWILGFTGNDELDPEAEFEEVASVAVDKDGNRVDIELE